MTIEQRPLGTLAIAFESVDWIIPPYFPNGALYELAENILKVSSREDKLRVLGTYLPRFYKSEYLAIMLLERYDKILHIKDFILQISEAIEASQMGLFHIAVTGLIPVLEGIIRKIANTRGKTIGDGTKNLVKEINNLIKQEKESPFCHGERITMLECFRNFFQKNLLIHTKNFSGSGNLNRHGILHGIFEKYGSDLNFFRLISLLDLLCFIISLKMSSISIFAPSPTKKSLKLTTYYLSLKVIQKNANKYGARFSAL